MIVPMKKITLLVLENEQIEALNRLRKLGLVHVEKKQTASESLTQLIKTKNDLSMVKSILGEYVQKKDKNKTSPSLMSREDGLAFAQSVLKSVENHKAAIEEIGRLRTALNEYKEWGNIVPADFEFLAEKGLFLFPAEISEKVYSKLSNEIKTIVLSAKQKIIRCVILSESKVLPENLPSDLRLLKLPQISTKEMSDKLSTLKAKLNAHKTEMQNQASYLNSIDNLIKIIDKELEFETIRTGMQRINLDTESENIEEKNRINIVMLSGYVPSEQEPQVSALARQSNWAYVSQEPAVDDFVPTKLKNNKFVNLISPLTEFLGTIPGYREPDISLWFLLFFGIFFAMIFGDAGYGSILVLLSASLMIRSKIKKQKIHTALCMLMYLGIMTVIWGTLVCNWFGMPMDYVPEVLQDLSCQAISNSNPVEDERNSNQMLFCFTLGLIQLLIAHLIGIIRNIKSPKFLGDAGSLLMVGGMYFVVLNLVIDAEQYPVNEYVLIAIGAGFALNFIFSNYETGIGQAILSSFANIINMCLGVVNVFADIMSYIRLWAVGLAGSAISMTVNEMAGHALGGFLIFAGVLLLFFGHGLNYVMNVLSVIVHGVRLNTLEFSNHLGLTWSGFKYEPFNE